MFPESFLNFWRRLGLRSKTTDSQKEPSLEDFFNVHKARENPEIFFEVRGLCRETGFTAKTWFCDKACCSFFWCLRRTHGLRGRSFRAEWMVGKWGAFMEEDCTNDWNGRTFNWLWWIASERFKSLVQRISGMLYLCEWLRSRPHMVVKRHFSAEIPWELSSLLSSSSSTPPFSEKNKYKWVNL